MANGVGLMDDPTERQGIFQQYRGAAILGAIVLAVLVAVPTTRAWLAHTFVFPLVADVLGRRMIIVDGTRVFASYPFPVQVLFAALLVLALVLLRAELLARQARGHKWARRVRLDGPFFLALTPFLGLGPVLAALESGLLFRVPWAFLHVSPLLYVTIGAMAIVSLLFGLWMEDGGRRHSMARFVTALFVFLSFDLFWISVMEGTTRRLAWWAAPLAVAVAFVVWYGVTLGNRLLSHRRALFALGTFHVAFFATFLVMWTVEGPWPAHGWDHEGVFALRIIPVHDPRIAFLLLGPPIGIAVAFYTLGQFLHRYSPLAEPWVHGLNVALVFSQTLDGWVSTVLYADPFGGLPVPMPTGGPPLAFLGTWGYFVAKIVFAVAAVWLLDRPLRGLAPAWQETGHLARAALVALGLEPGLRATIRLATGL